MTPEKVPDLRVASTSTALASLRSGTPITAKHVEISRPTLLMPVVLLLFMICLSMLVFQLHQDKEEAGTTLLCCLVPCLQAHTRKENKNSFYGHG